MIQGAKRNEWREKEFPMMKDVVTDVIEKATNSIIVQRESYQSPKTKRKYSIKSLSKSMTKKSCRNKEIYKNQKQDTDIAIENIQQILIEIK